MGASQSTTSVRTPNPNDLAMIMYTSGTTDLPKGVMMTHGNLIASIAGGTKLVQLRPDDVYIAYLPLVLVPFFEDNGVRHMCWSLW